MGKHSKKQIRLKARISKLFRRKCHVTINIEGALIQHVTIHTYTVDSKDIGEAVKRVFTQVVRDCDLTLP